MHDAVANLKNVHIIAGDVADYSTLEVSQLPVHTERLDSTPELMIWASKRAAKQVAEVTGGKLDCLIHNAANMNINTVHKGFHD